MKLASHLGMSIQRCKREHTSTEFLEWLAYLDQQELDRFDRYEHYLAQIALEVRRSYSRKTRIKLTDFLLKFTRESNKPKALTREENINTSKRTWFQTLGIPFSKLKSK